MEKVKPILPVVNVEDPVKTQVDSERQSDGWRMGRDDTLVQGTQNGHHIAHVDHFVVLRPQAVRVECFDDGAQFQLVNCI